VRRVNAIVVCGVVAGLVACGGDGRSFQDAAADACAQARREAGTTPASVARASGAALKAIRGLDVPVDARPFVQGLAQRQRALDALAAKARATSVPAQLRGDVEALDVQDSLLAKTAADAGVPRCGAQGDALVQRLKAADYAVGMRRFLAVFDARVDQDPPLRATRDLQRLRTEMEASYELFSSLGERLDALDAPDALQPLQERLSDAVSDGWDTLSGAEDRAAVGNRGAMVAMAARHRRAVARAKRLRREVEAALPTADAPSAADARRAADRDADAGYRELAEDVALDANSLFRESVLVVRDSRTPADVVAPARGWARRAAALVRRAEAIAPPARFRGAHARLVAALRATRSYMGVLAATRPGDDPRARIAAARDRLNDALAAVDRAYFALGVDLDPYG
jgi:hypothetical protein